MTLKANRLYPWEFELPLALAYIERPYSKTTHIGDAVLDGPTSVLCGYRGHWARRARYSGNAILPICLDCLAKAKALGGIAIVGLPGRIS